MTIQVHRNFLDNGREDCCHCGQPTAFWFEPKDVPLCPTCAGKLNNHMLVPTKKQWLESLGIVLPEGWLPYAVTRDAVKNNEGHSVGRVATQKQRRAA